LSKTGVNDTTAVGTQSVITIAAVNDAPVFVGPELITNGDFSTNSMAGWTTTGSASGVHGFITFGGGNAVGPHTADAVAMYLCDTDASPASRGGGPGMSVPCGTGADGLPVGGQIRAPARQEARMFQVAAELERRAPARTEGGAS